MMLYVKYICVEGSSDKEKGRIVISDMEYTKG